MSSLAATRPYQVVEFDEHRLDIRLKVVMSDPLGLKHEFEIERIWLLVIIDVCTRAVLGYSLVLELRAREKRWTSGGALKILESAVCRVSINGRKSGHNDHRVSIFLRKFAISYFEI
jgi:hypothetical protein